MEEEKVKVSYNGRMYEASKRGSSYSVYVGGATITNSSEGWKYICSDSEQPDYFFWIKYRKDGYMEYANDLMRRPGISDGVYRPDSYCMGTIEDSARTLYYVSKQLEAHEKIGVAPAEIMELRYKMMMMSLRMLGYKSAEDVLHGEPNSDVALMDLDRVVQFIEKYPAFSQYVSKGGYSSSPTIDVNIPQDFDKEKFKQEFDEAKAALDTEMEYYSERADFWGRIKHELAKNKYIYILIFRLSYFTDSFYYL